MRGGTRRRARRGRGLPLRLMGDEDDISAASPTACRCGSTHRTSAEDVYRRVLSEPSSRARTPAVQEPAAVAPASCFRYPTRSARVLHLPSAGLGVGMRFFNAGFMHQNRPMSCAVYRQLVTRSGILAIADTPEPHALRRRRPGPRWLARGRRARWLRLRQRSGSSTSTTAERYGIGTSRKADLGARLAPSINGHDFSQQPGGGSSSTTRASQRLGRAPHERARARRHGRDGQRRHFARRSPAPAASCGSPTRSSAPRAPSARLATDHVPARRAAVAGNASVAESVGCRRLHERRRSSSTAGPSWRRHRRPTFSGPCRGRRSSSSRARPRQADAMELVRRRRRLARGLPQRHRRSRARRRRCPGRGRAGRAARGRREHERARARARGLGGRRLSASSCARFFTTADTLITSLAPGVANTSERLEPCLTLVTPYALRRPARAELRFGTPREPRSLPGLRTRRRCTAPDGSGTNLGVPCPPATREVRVANNGVDWSNALGARRARRRARGVWQCGGARGKRRHGSRRQRPPVANYQS